jgi:hypothetical protein
MDDPNLRPVAAVVAPGRRRVEDGLVKWRDAAGDWSSPKSDSILLDRVVSTATVPASSITANTALSSGRIPVRLAWSGHDDRSGISRFEWLARRMGLVVDRIRHDRPEHERDLVARPYVSLPRPGRRPRRQRRCVGLRFLVPSDGDLPGQQLRPLPGHVGELVLDDLVGRHREELIEGGSTASYTFTGRSIAWVSLKASNRGKANVYVNGVLKATIDLYSATTTKQLVVWSANYSTSATRTVTIKVLGTSGRPRVDVDGFIVGS